MPNDVLLCTRCWGDVPAAAQACPSCAATDGLVTLPLPFRGIYEVRERLSRDAGIAVFRAVDTRGGGPVLLKVQRRDGSREALRARLEALSGEQAALVALGDIEGEPLFPQLLGMERTEPAYLAIEAIELPTLEQLVALRPLSPISVAWTGISLVRCLEAIAARRLVHEALRPGAILVREGDWHVLVGDVAGCRRRDDPGAAAELPLPGIVREIGAFAAPSGLDADPRTADVHVLGQLLWFAATGAAPFPAGTAESRAARMATVPPRPDGLPPALYELLAGALAPSGEDRPTTVGLGEALDAYARAVLRDERLADLRERVHAALTDVAPLAGLPARSAELDASIGAIAAYAEQGLQAEFDAAADAAEERLRALDAHLAEIRAAESPRLTAMINERDAAQARVGELDAMRVALANALAERDAAVAARDAGVSPDALAERDEANAAARAALAACEAANLAALTATAERTEAINERDTAFVARDAALAERDVAVAGQDVAVAALARREAAVASELAAVAGERDAALAERDAAVAARDAAFAERDSALVARDAALAARDGDASAAIVAERDAALARVAELDAARIAIGTALAEEEATVAALKEELDRRTSSSANRETLAALELERERVLVLDGENRRLASALDAARAHPVDAEPTVEIGPGTAHAVTLASLEEARAALGAERARSAALQAERDEAGARLAAEVRRTAAARPAPEQNPWPMVFLALFIGLLAGGIGGKLYGDMGRTKTDAKHATAAPVEAPKPAAKAEAPAEVPAAAPVAPVSTPAPAVEPPAAEAPKPAAAPAAETAKPPAAKPPATTPATTPAAAAPSAKALLKSGWAAAEKSDYAGAVSLFDQAIKAGGGADARFGRAYARENLGDIAGAVADYCASQGGANAERKREVEGILSRLGRTCN